MTDYTQEIHMYVEVIAGGIIEIIWLMKTFLVLYIIFSAWRLVRK